MLTLVLCDVSQMETSYLLIGRSCWNWATDPFVHLHQLKCWGCFNTQRMPISRR